MRALLFLGAAISCLATMPAAIAQTKTLYVGMNGGTIEKGFTQGVFPPFEAENGVKIVIVPGTSTDILAKTEASKAKPQTHVIMMDDLVMARAIGLGLCTKLEYSAELDQLPKLSRYPDDMAAGVSMSMSGLAYNTRVFEKKGWAPPTSWMDLADPKFRDLVVVPSMPSSSYGLHAFLMFNRIQGGTDSNVEPGFKEWPKAIGKNVLEYFSNSAKLSEMVQTDELAIFPFALSQVAAFQRQNIPVAFSAPKEGTPLLFSAVCPVAGNSEPELAQKLARYMLSVPAQTLALKHANLVPSNPGVTGDATTTPILDQTRKAAANAIRLDWTAINQNRADWNARWNREIER
ncbi:ABC transporter substrate-binding protein [Chelatococcus asaccharovorans]|uniref:Putative spermidine/putrescine transport system substrate-binding protein n=1 Tax=Chelatococcus asaccharovorans TaxID=28210 RepID=A0A2V3TTF0_9HYPH|nr:ABC transporter substrate-binding protein [Chelatococcus asaccharovorans]MBS7707849.1 polyamine ABC transporter substrate-binding protein [Chelatococcus asaccharovorans]PXW50905.1 putative spermidine/putrescine transport system substrate-binding protein [Chelatococcus asaccharovorans]